MMHGREKSDSSIVPTKPANKARRRAAELMEGREEALGNARRQSTHRTLSRASVSPALARIRQVICFPVIDPAQEPDAGIPLRSVGVGGG
jgi:RNA-directed DNA polymerase